MTMLQASVGGPLRVFVSYSHDSQVHVDRVLALANRLRMNGIDCHIDQYEISPAEGWPAWMETQISIVRFVLVVCTEVYARRIAGREHVGRGLGARWEGAIITQALYDSGGRNDKFIPVVFSENDIVHIPHFLRGVTRYDLSNDIGYEALYRHLTDQPRVTKPPLGSVQVLRAAEPLQLANPTPAPGEPAIARILLMSFDSSETFFLPLSRVTSAATVNVSVKPASPHQSAFLERLGMRPDAEIGVAFGRTAFLGHLKDLTRVYESGEETSILTFQSAQADYGASFMEPGMSGAYTADEIATLRARRILLNERLDIGDDDVVARLNGTMLEVLVRGMNTPLQVIASPLPALFTDVGQDRTEFLQAAQLLLTLYLRLSGVVEHVFRLELTFAGAGLLHVEFDGQRARKFSNVAPQRITISGVCDLRENGVG